MKVREVMHADPVAVSNSTPILECARRMKEENIGTVIITDDGTSNGRPIGLVTDRDIVVRALAGGAADPLQTTVGKICTPNPAQVAADAEVEVAISMMRDRKVRRLPVVENERTVGIVSLGDLAVARDPKSVLGQISAAPPND